MSYVVVARCVAQDEHKDEIEAVLREFVPQCRREPGHRDFVAQKTRAGPALRRRARRRGLYRERAGWRHAGALFLPRLHPLATVPVLVTRLLDSTG